jgi:colanic acid/amylovoran biosynthesis glycosyltransferase
MSLAIASPIIGAGEGTFIQSQFDRLPWKLRVHGSAPNFFTEPGGYVLPHKGSLGKRFPGICLRALEKARILSAHRTVLKSRLRRAGITSMLVNYGPMAMGLVDICDSLGIKMCVHFHGYDASNEAVLRRYAPEYRKHLPRVHSVLAVSRKMKDRLIELGAPAEKIRVVPCGVDTRRFKAPEAKMAGRVCLSVGRFVDKKAPQLTLLAFQRVAELDRDARLVMVGDGDLWQATRSLAAAFGLESKVEFPGDLSHEEVLRRMQSADVFVQHSVVPRFGPSAGDSEGTPVAIMEALACGLPVVSTRHGGIPEVITHGTQGLLVDEYDVAGMAQSMAELLAAPPEKRKAMGEAGRARIEEAYSMDRYMADLRQAVAGSD